MQLVNNTTSNTYISTAVTTGTGLFTVLNVPAGNYSVNISTISPTGPWTSTGDTNYYIGADVNSSNAFQATQSIAGGSLTLNDNNSKIVPGSNQLSLRNHADGADNVLISDSGMVTVRNGVIVSAGGVTISAGPLNASSTITTSQEITGGDLKASGSVGVFSSPARLLGKRGLSGTPTTGTYSAGDIGLDGNSVPMVCTAAGTPGSWSSVGWLHWQRYVVGPGGALDTSSNPGGDIPMPSGFNHAMVVISKAIDTSNNTNAAFGGMQIAVSGGSLDTATNYVWTDKDVFTFTNGNSSEGVGGSPNGQDIAWGAFALSGGGTGAGWYSSAVIWLPNYSDATAHQSAFWDIFQINNSTAVRRMGGGYHVSAVGNVTSLHFFARTATMAAGTTFDLYVMS